jgi:peptidoglycan LD-endopeptidase LytH
VDAPEAKIVASLRRRPPFARRTIVALLAPLTLIPLACDLADSDSIGRPYLPRSAHQAYGYSLIQARLTQAALGRDWLTAGEQALEQPAVVALPHAADVGFDASTAAAWGYRISGRAGQRIRAEVRVEALERVEMFVDVFRVNAGALAHIATAPPTPALAEGAEKHAVEWQVLEPGDYIVRVQPELLRAGAVRVEIRAAPLLAFPVTGVDRRAIQSGFGAERDGGARVHRGVDIFAPRGTNAVAALDAWVSRVDTTSRGGNVVWLQPLFGEMRLYYAHLDTQLVKPGQFVQSGEVVGTVGNTGNARTTPPHLHFGVYLRRRGMRGGATDPTDFLH